MNTLTPERIKAFWLKNGGTICTIVAVGWLVKTVYLAVRTTPKAMQLNKEYDAILERRNYYEYINPRTDQGFLV